MGWAGHVASVGEKRNAYVGMVGETISKSWTFMRRLDVKVKVKVKLTLEQATKFQRGNRGIPLVFF